MSNVKTRKVEITPPIYATQVILYMQEAEAIALNEFLRKFLWHEENHKLFSNFDIARLDTIQKDIHEVLGNYD